MGTALILYPNQLFDVELLPKAQRVYMVEEPLLFGTDSQFPLKYHKQKLVLHRASMRRYAEEVLWPNGFEVEYIECTADVVTDTAIVKAAFDGASEIVVFDPCDHVLSARIKLAAGALEVHVPIRWLENPNFYLRSTDVVEYFAGSEQHSFEEFYQWQRERFDVLIDKDYHPYGGKWTMDTKTKHKLPVDVQLPGMASYGNNPHVVEAVQYVESKFSSNPGRLDTFMWPTNRQESLAWMQEFFRGRLSGYSELQDTIDARGVWLYHSALSPMMNCGFLSSREVVEAALEYGASAKTPPSLESLEGFIRQILGFREYNRGIYMAHGIDLQTKNALGNHRSLTSAWYDANTGIPPLDDVLNKANNFGYAHQSERLSVVGNMMLLSEIDPAQAYAWFMTHFLDSYAWACMPNVYGMSQFADGGLYHGKPNLVASNYVLSLSSYTKDRWCDVWDGLYWKFVDTHRIMLKKQLRMGPALVVRYDQMDPARKRIIGYRAQDFLDTCTTI